MKVTFIIPCYASENSISLVMEEIRSQFENRDDAEYEIVAVNDCSPDDVLGVLIKEAKNDPNIKVIDLAKNGGRHNALICGCHYATGDYIVFIDDDLQCPTDRVWDLLKPIIDDNYDVAIARYSKKKQSIIKNAGSRFNDFVGNWLLGKDKDLKFSNFSCMKKFVKDEIIKYDNPYPYMSGLMHRTTDRICNVDMEERERTIGEGHYTLRKSIALWMNNFTAFSVKPLRMASVAGAFASIIGIILCIVTIIRKILDPSVLMGYSSLMAALLFIGGIIMLMLGLIGEYIGRIYISLNNSPQFVVRDTLNIKEGK